MFFKTFILLLFVMSPARAFDLSHHFEVHFIFLFLRLLLNNPSFSYSPGVHVHPYQHGSPVLRSAYRCASGVSASTPTGCSTPASTRPIKYTSCELLALQAPVHLAPELIPALKALDIGYRLPRRRSCRGGARNTRAISVVGRQRWCTRLVKFLWWDPGSVRSRPCVLSPSTTPASFCHHLPRPPPSLACSPDNFLHINLRFGKISPRSTSLPGQPVSPSPLSTRSHWEQRENAPCSVILSMNTT